MAAGAGQETFPHRVMARQLELGLRVHVTGEADLFLGVGQQSAAEFVRILARCMCHFVNERLGEEAVLGRARVGPGDLLGERVDLDDLQHRRRRLRLGRGRVLLDERLERLRGFVTIAGNPVLSTPNGPRLDRALEGLDFMVAQDIFLPRTAELADVVLGYIDPDYFLGGRMKLDKSLAEKAINEKIAKPLGLSAVDKVAMLRAIAETGRNCSARSWITEVNWPLWEGPHSPAGKSRCSS